MKKNKKIMITSSFLLAGGVIGSVALSQVSFATNSYDDNIQMLSENTNIDNGIVTYGDPSPSSLSDSQIGISAGAGYSPFWKSNDLPNGTWHSAADKYKYYQAPKAEGFDAIDIKNQEVMTNPGIAMAWYANGKNGPYKNNYIAGPGMFSFYTRQMEDYFYSPNNNGYQDIFKTPEQKTMFKDVFFTNITDSNTSPNAIVDFIKKITTENGYGTGNNSIAFLDLNTKKENGDEIKNSGSVLSHLLFRQLELDTNNPMSDDYANMQLYQTVFYPSNNKQGSAPISNNEITTTYNKVWLGNEKNQQEVMHNSPIRDYTNAKNSAIMRAVTLDSFTMVSQNKSYSSKYQATGNIKFRIFYEYDFKRSPETLDFEYDIDSLVNNSGIALEDYLSTKLEYDKYKDNITNNNVNDAYSTNDEAIQKLIIDNYQIMMKNYKYTGNDAVDGDEKPIPSLTVSGFNDGLNTNEVIIGKGKITIDPSNESISSITVPVTIDIQPKLTRTIKINFKTRKSTEVIKNTFNVNNNTTATININKQSAISIIQNNLNQIFKNTNFNNNNATVIDLENYDNFSRAKEGIIQFSSIILNDVVVNGNIVNNYAFKPINGESNFSLTGYQPITADQLQTVVRTNVDLSAIEDWRTFIPETLSKEQSVIEKLKASLIANQAIYNPPGGEAIDVTNIEQLTVSSFNNIDGTATLSIVLNKYYDTNGQLVNGLSQPYSMKITGLKQLLITTLKTDLTNCVDYVNQQTSHEKYASEITIENIKKFINDNTPAYFLDNPIDLNIDVANNNKWLSNTIVELDTSRPENQQYIVDNNAGTITVYAQYNYYQSQTANGVVTTPQPFEFTLTGYKNITDDKNEFTTTIDQGALAGVLEIIPDTINTSSPEIESIIKPAIISSGLVKYLNPKATAPLDVSDISLSNFQPISKDGILNCDVTVNNSKAWTDGVVNQSKVISASFSGFKTQAPTETIPLTSPIDLGLNDFDLNNVETNFQQIKDILNTKVNEIVFNQYPGSSIDFSYDPTGVNLANGTLRINVNITNGYYDDKGNSQPTGSITKQIIASGFMKSDVLSTNLSTNIQALGVSDIVLTTENQTNNANLIQVIKKIVAENLINHTPGRLPTPEDILNVTIEPNSISNATGSLTVTVEVSKQICLQNGATPAYNLTFTTTISGFKKLQPTTIGDLNNTNIFNKNQNVNSFAYDPQTIIQIQNALLDPNNNALKADMFPNGLPTSSSIKISFSNIDPLNGSCTVNVTIPGPYVDADLNVIDMEFTTSFNLTGFQATSVTTDIVNNPVIEANNIIASQWDSVDNIEKVKTAIVKAQKSIFVNLTPGKELTTNDIQLEPVISNQSQPVSRNVKNTNPGEYNNLEGSVQFKLTLLNGTYCLNGVAQDKFSFEKPVTITGFKKLKITDFNGLNVSLGSVMPSQFIKNPNAVNELKQNIVNALIHNPQYQGMFPNGLPTVNDIAITINSANDDSGQVSVNVSISNIDYIPAEIESPAGSGNYKRNDKGEIVSWSQQSQQYRMTNINLTGFQQTPWAQRHWLIITLASIGAAAAIVLIVLLALKATGKLALRKQ